MSVCVCVCVGGGGGIGMSCQTLWIVESFHQKYGPCFVVASLKGHGPLVFVHELSLILPEILPPSLVTELREFFHFAFRYYCWVQICLEWEMDLCRPCYGKVRLPHNPGLGEEGQKNILATWQNIF